MTGLDLRNRMNEAIMSLPKPDAELQIEDIRNLDGLWNDITCEARRDVCEHPENERDMFWHRYCLQCGSYVEPELSTKESG